MIKKITKEAFNMQESNEKPMLNNDRKTPFPMIIICAGLLSFILATVVNPFELSEDLTLVGAINISEATTLVKLMFFSICLSLIALLISPLYSGSKAPNNSGANNSFLAFFACSYAYISALFSLSLTLGFETGSFLTFGMTAVTLISISIAFLVSKKAISVSSKIAFYITLVASLSFAAVFFSFSNYSKSLLEKHKEAFTQDLILSTIISYDEKKEELLNIYKAETLNELNKKIIQTSAGSYLKDLKKGEDSYNSIKAKLEGEVTVDRLVVMLNTLPKDTIYQQKKQMIVRAIEHKIFGSDSAVKAILDGLNGNGNELAIANYVNMINNNGGSLTAFNADSPLGESLQVITRSDFSEANEKSLDKPLIPMELLIIMSFGSSSGIIDLPASIISSQDAAITSSQPKFMTIDYASSASTLAKSIAKDVTEEKPSEEELTSKILDSMDNYEH